MKNIWDFFQKLNANLDNSLSNSIIKEVIVLNPLGINIIRDIIDVISSFLLEIGNDEDRKIHAK